MFKRDFGREKLQEIINCINEYFEDEEEIGFFEHLWDNISRWFRGRSTKNYVVSLSASKKKTEDAVRKIWKGVFSVEDEFQVIFQNTDNIAQEYISAINSISNCINIKTLSSSVDFSAISKSLDEVVKLNKIDNAAYVNKKQSARADILEEFGLGLMKKSGFIGKAVALAVGIKDTATGGGAGKLIKTVSSGVKDVSNIYKYAKNMGKAKRILHSETIRTSWAKKIVGWNDYFKSANGVSKATGWGRKFKSNLTKAKNISKVSWLSVAVSGVVNAIDNRKEYEQGKISAERAVAETLTETAVDVVTDAALTTVAAAAVGATTAALGLTVGAPVLVVGAVTVGAKIGLDAIAKWATGGEKDFTEAASDLILDTGKAIGKGISEGASKLGKCISSSLKSLKPKWCFGF